MAQALKKQFDAPAFSDGNGSGGEPPGTISQVVLWPLKDELTDEENIEQAADFVCDVRDEHVKNALQGKLPLLYDFNIKLHYDSVLNGGILVRQGDTKQDIIEKINLQVFGAQPIPLFPQAQ